MPKPFKFYNVGKANAEIERLEIELQAAKAATPETNSARVDELLSSNAESSTRIETLTTDLSTAKEANKVAVENAQKEKAENVKILAALKTSCEAMKLTEVKADATAFEMISAMQGAVTATLAKLQVDPAKVPAGIPTTASGQAAKKMSLDEEIRAQQAANPTK